MYQNIRTEKEEGNMYFEGYLNSDDKENLKAYDYCADQVDSFFSNLQIFDDLIRRTSVTEDEINIFDSVDTSVFTYQMDKSEWNKLPNNVRMLLILRENINIWIENERNALGTSMIENTSDKDLEKNRRKYERAKS